MLVFLYSLTSICIVSPILTTIILCVIILIKTICFVCRCNCFFFCLVIDKQIDIVFLLCFWTIGLFIEENAQCLCIIYKCTGNRGENITFNLS